MALFIFMNTDTWWDEVLRFEGAISHHWENINNIVWQTVGSVVGWLSIEVHFEFTSGHLGDAIVNGFVSVKSGLEVSVFKQQVNSTVLWCLISWSDVDENAQIYVWGDAYWFGENSDSGGEFGRLISWGDSVDDSAFSRLNSSVDRGLNDLLCGRWSVTLIQGV